MLPYRLDGKSAALFEFQLSDRQANKPAWLRIHTADQDEKIHTLVAAIVNGRRMERILPKGLGIQVIDPAHLAFPATAQFLVPVTSLHAGTNRVEVRIHGNGWFTWDAMDLINCNQTCAMLRK
ncbi:MAG: hypothetical protein M1608_08950 [Candidatus Omnitrophica bacterium]|nr:hypothetical protein [Candidatus Omnitrophota bacterium]